MLTKLDSLSLLPKSHTVLYTCYSCLPVLIAVCADKLFDKLVPLVVAASVVVSVVVVVGDGGGGGGVVVTIFDVVVAVKSIMSRRQA